MDTKYGIELDNSFVDAYSKKLVDKIFKLLPLRDEGNENLPKYHESLMIEILGSSKLLIGLQNKSEFVSMLSSLEMVLTIEDKALYKRKVFECINLAKKLV